MKTLSAVLALCHKENVYSPKMTAYSATNDEKVVTLMTLCFQLPHKDECSQMNNKELIFVIILLIHNECWHLHMC